MNRCSTVQYSSFLYLLRCVLDGEPPSRKGLLSSEGHVGCRGPLSVSFCTALPRLTPSQSRLQSVTKRVRSNGPVHSAGAPCWSALVLLGLHCSSISSSAKPYFPFFHKCQFLINIMTTQTPSQCLPLGNPACANMILFTLFCTCNELYTFSDIKPTLHL